MLTYEDETGLKFMFENVENKKLRLIRCNADNVKIKDKAVIPEEINGIPIKEIGNGDVVWGLQGYKTIVFPQSLKKINKNAFLNYESLENIVLPHKMTSIKENAFRNTGIKSVNLPEGIKVIWQSTFAFCENLKTIKLPSTLIKIEKSAFFNCGSLENINIPNKLEEIKDFAFLNCEKLYIKNFKNIREIGEQSFKNCLKFDTIKFNKKMVINPSAFYDCKNLKEAVFKNNVDYLGPYVFYNTALKAAKFYEDIRYISSLTFDCNNKIDIYLNENNDNLKIAIKNNYKKFRIKEIGETELGTLIKNLHNEIEGDEYDL